MTDDDLDRVLSGEDDIVPSSGFAASVMDTVRREAMTPPPLVFPWKRAVPGLVALALVLIGFPVAAILQVPAVPTAALLSSVIERGNAIGAGWMALALLLSFVSVRLSMRLAGGRV